MSLNIMRIKLETLLPESCQTVVSSEDGGLTMKTAFP